MKINKLTPGMTVYSVERQKMGNSTASTIAIYSVKITEVHDSHVLASWNGNAPRKYFGSAISKWKLNKPEHVGEP